MRVLVAPDSFTGTLTAVEAAGAIATGWLRHDGTADLDLAPMSDGGPGLVDAIAASLPGERQRLGDASLLRTADGTVFVEATQAGGLGAVLVHVRDRLAPRRVVVGTAGSADAAGGPDRHQGLVDAMGGPGAWPRGVPLVLATPAGETVGGLLRQLELVGGVRASGVQTVLDAIGLPSRAETADLLVTGEGTFDETSLQGKATKGVAWVAQRAGRPCVVLAGRVMIARREFSAAGVDGAYAVEEIAGSLADLAERVARSWTPRAS